MNYIDLVSFGLMTSNQTSRPVWTFLLVFGDFSITESMSDAKPKLVKEANLSSKSNDKKCLIISLFFEAIEKEAMVRRKHILFDKDVW